MSETDAAAVTNIKTLWAYGAQWINFRIGFLWDLQYFNLGDVRGLERKTYEEQLRELGAV